MTRCRELVLRIVLNEISNDYENLHQITKQVRRTSSDCGMTISVHEILQALADLVAAGLAKPYRLSNGVKGIDGMPPAGEIGSPDEPDVEDAFFWITKKGMKIHVAECPDWPFDDNNVLRADWIPPKKLNGHRS
jgi:hypothetical protein